MEVAGVYLDGGEIFDAQLIHHNRVDFVHNFAQFLLIVMTYFHIIEQNLFHMTQNYNQIVTQKFN